MKCIFCGKDIQTVDKVVLECKHTFHFRCLFRVSRNSEKCPICNKILLEQKMEHDPVVRERLRVERGEWRTCQDVCNQLFRWVLRNLSWDGMKALAVIFAILGAVIMSDVDKKDELEKAIKINDWAATQKIIAKGMLYSDAKVYALCLAGKYGQIDIINHLIKIGIDLHADNDCAYRAAVENGHDKLASDLKFPYRR